MTFVVGLFAGYVISSFVLLRRPHLLHQSRNFPIHVQHISHRGGAGERIENSMDAFRNAVVNGTQMLELDCHLTRDNEVVVFHDSELMRATGTAGCVADCEYGSLPPYLNKLPVTFEPGQVCEQLHSPPSRILRLRDVFDAFPDVIVNIDIKANDDRLISEVSNLINEYQRQKRTVWGAMDRKVAAKCRRTNPEVLMYPPLAHGLGYILAYHIGLLPFLPIPYDCFEFPLMQAIKDKRPMHWQANNTWKTRAVVHLLCYLMSFPGMYEHIKRRGIPVFMWVGNTYSEFRTAFELGATGVMTDYPSRLRAFLDGDTKMSDRTTSS